MTSRTQTDRADVIVVGAGPVGLSVGVRLTMRGFRTRVLERSTEPAEDSRSIGIHPPALEALAEIGSAEPLVAEGISVRQGALFAGTRRVGGLSFDHCPGPYRFVLAIEQWKTQRILEARLRELDAEALVRGEEVADITSTSNSVHVRTTTGSTFEAQWVVGCDGRRSAVRRLFGVDFVGGRYTDRYLMGDFADDTALGATAAIFLGREGLVESFPLPHAVRRWVVRLTGNQSDDRASTLADIVRRRTGHELEASTARMTSQFSAERWLATTMAKGRMLLAGDAAHIVSPIGGQGMNLGWLDARHAVAAIEAGTAAPSRSHQILEEYSRARRRAAVRAARRAEFNMRFGRPSANWLLAAAAARMMVTPPISRTFARRFTMRGL